MEMNMRKGEQFMCFLYILLDFYLSWLMLGKLFTQDVAFLKGVCKFFVEDTTCSCCFVMFLVLQRMHVHTGFSLVIKFFGNHMIQLHIVHRNHEVINICWYVVEVQYLGSWQILDVLESEPGKEYEEHLYILFTCSS